MLEFWAVVASISLSLTILAFILKSNVFYSPMLHSVAVLGWLITTVLMVKAAIDTYADEQIALAVGLFGVSIVITETVAILLPYLRERKSTHEQYNQRQASYRTMIYSKTTRQSKWSDML